MVWLRLMASQFNRYIIKIILMKWNKDLVATIKIPISNVKLSFYLSC